MPSEFTGLSCKETARLLLQSFGYPMIAVPHSGAQSKGPATKPWRLLWPKPWWPKPWWPKPWWPKPWWPIARCRKGRGP